MYALLYSKHIVKIESVLKDKSTFSFTYVYDLSQHKKLTHIRTIAYGSKENVVCPIRERIFSNKRYLGFYVNSYVMRFLDESLVVKHKSEDMFFDTVVRERIANKNNTFRMFLSLTGEIT